MSSSNTETLGQMNSLVGTLSILQSLEVLFLNQEQMEQPSENLEEQVRRLQMFKRQVKWFNTERLRILNQLRQKVSYHVAVEHHNAMSLRQGIVELRQGLNGLNERMNRMYEDITCSICLSPWTLQGRHRAVSLKCGHIFGKVCIHTAIRRFHRCPICRRRALQSDVRRIFCRGVLP
ncbi:uncharacterized protein LOC108086906 [Drosophila ficusphila]|uniref:uncharacterized protein LOC108086906 n=1 Tax=Drosophila ficusphila TaxID=30025 RepID=UPI0007E805C8|nr:uncharacterized protein LOC108086906 [Drosophila ficusphila]